MKTSFWENLFVAIRPKFEREANGALLDHPKIQNSRLPFGPVKPKKGPGMTQILSFFALVLAVSAAVLGFAAFGLFQQNKSILTKFEESKNALQEVQSAKINMENALADLKKENETLLERVKKSENELASVMEEKTYLEEILINKTKEIERIKKGSPVSAETSGTSGAAELEKLQEQNLILSKKLEKLYKTTNAKIAEINVAKITLEETISEARKAIDTEWNSVDLGSINASPAAVSRSKKSEIRTTPKKEGKVLAINESHGFVVVDMGKLDGVTDNSIFSLIQNGQGAGSLKVLEIRETMTACNIQNLDPGKKIQVNDLISLQK